MAAQLNSGFAFGTIATPQGDQATLIVGGRHYLLSRLLPDLPATGLRAHLDHWERLLARVTQLLDGHDGLRSHAAAAIDAPQVLAPIRYPNKLVCVGAVYQDHLLQMGLPAERWPNMPLFLRPPTTSIVGPGRTVRIPSMTRQFDWEIELAVVIGRRLSEVSEAEAAAGVAGYCVGIDFGCRDLLDRGSAIGVDLVRSKAQDTMAPIGPALMPAAFVPDPQHLALRLWVNGEQRQDGNTASMLYSINEQIATISRYITLEPGDIIFTGSPAGSARSNEQYLRAGDRIRAEIAGVGTLDVELYRGAAASARPLK